jgi:hypothetical protein
MAKKQLTLEDLQPQYEAFCENVRAVRQNTQWRTVFNKIEKDAPDAKED